MQTPLESNSMTLHQKRRIYIIGLIGGIASGETTITKEASNHGVASIDSDSLGHKAYLPGNPAYTKLVETFGEDILNQNDKLIDRKILGSKVFGDASKLKELTDIVWPSIADLVTEEISKLDTEGIQIAILEAPLLIEAGWKNMVDEIWLTEVPVEVVKERLMARNNLTDDEATKRINSQSSQESKVQWATQVIQTGGTKESVAKQVSELIEVLKSRLERV